MSANKTWIVVADGAHARLFETAGPGSGLSLLPEGEFSADTQPTREIGTDRPGRVHDRMGPGRHAMAPRVDWHRQAKQDFLRALAEVINAAATAEDYGGLLLVAPPQALGELRKHLGKAAESRVVGELARDLTHISVHELPGHLGDAVRL